MSRENRASVGLETAGGRGRGREYRESLEGTGKEGTGKEGTGRTGQGGKGQRGKRL